MSGMKGQAPYVICYLCGRKYGTKSIAIHEPHCIKKWHAVNQKLPKHLRRKIPTKPDYSKLSSGDFDGNYVDQMNEKSYKAAQEQLIPCGNCGRTFLPDRLAIHQKSCTADKPAHRPQTTSKSRINKLGYDPNPYPPPPELEEQVPSSAATTMMTTTKPKSQKRKEILCGLCMKKIPASIIQNHLVKCNEEKIRHMHISSGSKQFETKADEIPERPSTRTLNREPSPNLPSVSSGTYDIDSPDEMEQQPSKQIKMRKKQPPAKINQYHPSPPPEHGAYSLKNSNGDSGVNDEKNLVNCEMCNRHFAVDRIDKHKIICQKTKSKARKVFDSSKQRLEGTEAAATYRKSQHSSSKTKASKGNWRQTHDDFIRSIRAAKQVTKHMANGGKASDLPPPPPSLNPDYVHCQYCDRRFNPEVAERHIPKCATTANRPKPPKQKALDVYNKFKPGAKFGRENTTNRGMAQGGNKGMYNQNIQNGNSREMSFSNGGKSRQNDIRNSPREQNGYGNPRIDRGYNNFNSVPTPPSSHSRRVNNTNNRTPQNDPYKPKTFSGMNNRQATNRGFSYNSMNHTGPNFFG